MQIFWDKVNKTDTCWLWTAAGNGRTSSGMDYGLFKIPKTRKNITAHRMSYILHNGPITSDQWVLHKCDTPRCVNPNHLFLGDAAANVADMDAKGRRVSPHNVGELNGRAVMNPEKIDLLKLLYKKFSIRELSAIFGIGKSQIYRILGGAQWKSSIAP